VKGFGERIVKLVLVYLPAVGVASVVIQLVEMDHALVRMAFKDLLVNYAKTQTCLAVTAMKLVSVNMESVTVG